ncbi:hypothetical protein L1049_003528 [Liquidambar formosana]|uniref:DUF4378 domain-containing protein n=1 Tax=Liquidambar formosana TaxID=63359 RepID=A0AAP0R289_LIQFO
MAERSPYHPALCEKYQSGCLRGLINFFDFRQSHPNRKLLSDKRHVKRHAVGTEYSRSRLNLLTNFDENFQGINDGVDNRTLTVDVGKTSVKNLTEEEMSAQKYLKKHITIEKNHKRESKTCQRACQTPVNGWKDAASVGQQQCSPQNSGEKSLTKLDPVSIMEAFCNQIHCNNGRDCCDIHKSMSVLKHDQLNEINLHPVQMSEAAEAFISQKFIVEKRLITDEASHQSKQFLDAQEILNSDRELFLKLLQDPNSLLVKHIQDLQDSQAEKDLTKSFSETKLSDYGITYGRQCEEPVDTQKQNMHKPFFKKIKFWDRYQSKESGDPQPSTEMILLKPGLTSIQNFKTNTSYYSSLQSHHSLRNKGHGFRPTYFSFESIKRKLKYAVGESREEQHWISMIGALCKFPYDRHGSKDGAKANRTTTCVIDVKRSDKKCKPNDFEQSIGHEVAPANEGGHKNLNSSTVTDAKRRESYIYIEAKRHLSKILSNGVVDADFSRKRVPTTLGRILSSREYDFSPTYGPGRDGEHGFETAQMRFAPYSNYCIATASSWELQEEKKTSCVSPLKQNVEAPPCGANKLPDDQLYVLDSKQIISENHFEDSREHESISSSMDDSSPEGYAKSVETSDVICPGKINFLDVYEPNNTPTTSANQSTDTANVCEENGFSKCSRLDSSLDNQPPSPLSIQKVVDLDSIKDKAEQPSPVSVLEPFFIDDVTSPTSTISQHAAAKPPMQPLQINFEENFSSAPVITPSDPKINFSTCMEDEASTSEYVRAVLKSSGLNWEELAVNWHLSDQLLDPSLFDEMELLPIQSCGEPKLYFDCINEVLLDVCQHYFRCSPWLPSIKLKILPVQVEKFVVHEVMDSFDRHLLLQQSPPHALEWLAVKDIEKSGKWMDIRIDTEDIVIEMVEASLEELIMETIVEQQT